ncbi:MAG: DUF4260 family protein [Rhodobacteraceae bacterium]|nr:DUF4260 family protein [Paracoccaceae bacterium]
MIVWQRIEGAIIAVMALVLLSLLPPQLPLFTPDLLLWLIVILFFVPDMSLIAYIGGPKLGAFFYNLMHLYPSGVAPFFVGLVFGNNIAVAAGVLMVAHVGAERAVGFGLKSSRGFKYTHLGKFGKDT